MRASSGMERQGMEFMFGNEGTEGQHHQGADGRNVRIRRVLITAKTRNTSDSTEFRVLSPFSPPFTI